MARGGTHVPSCSHPHLSTPIHPPPLPTLPLCSLCRGIEATQAVIDLCAAHKIIPDIKEIGPEGINGAFEDLDNANPSGCRYVINLAGLKNIEEMAAKCASVPPPPQAKREPLGLGLIVGGIFKLLCCCGWRKY